MYKQTLNDPYKKQKEYMFHKTKFQSTTKII